MARQSLEEELWNGAVRQYLVTVNPSPPCSIPLQHTFGNITRTEVTFVTEDKCGHIIQIKAQNEIGLSENASVLNLDKYSDCKCINCMVDVFLMFRDIPNTLL